MSVTRAGPFWWATIKGKHLRIDRDLKVLSFEVTLRKEDVPSLKFEISNATKTLLSDPDFVLGAEVTFKYGYEGKGWWSPERTFVISELQVNYPPSGHSTIVYVALSKSVAASKIKRSSIVEEGQTVRDFLDSFAETYNWIVRGPTETPAMHGMYQTNESDLGMVRRLIREFGYEMTIKDEGGTPVLEFWGDIEEVKATKFWTYQGGSGDHNAGIISFSPKVSRFNKPSARRASSIDPSTKQPFSERGSDTTTERTTTGEAPISTENTYINGETKEVSTQVVFPGESDTSEVESSPEEVSESVVDAPADADPWYPSEEIDEVGSCDPEELKRKQGGRFKEDERKMNKGTLVLVGDPDVEVGTVALLAGLDAPLNGNWVVDEVVHKVAPAPYLITMKVRKKSFSKVKESVGCVPSKRSLATSNSETGVDSKTGEVNGQTLWETMESLLTPVTVIDGETKRVTREVR